MKTMKKITVFVLILSLLAAVLCGCGSAAPQMASADRAMPMATAVEAPMAEMAVAEDGALNMMTGAKLKSAPVAGAGEIKADNAGLAKKIIYTANLTVETLTFEQSVEALTGFVTELGGFVENSNVYGNTSYDESGVVSVTDRNANYSFRIPAEKLETFLQQAGTVGNVTSKSMTATNVTSQYTDFEARRDSLKTEQTRLLELLEKADTVETLLAIESKLTDVRYELDSIERNLRNLDNEIAYSVVYVNLYEVRVYTPTTTAQRSIWQRIGDAFVNGWKHFVRGIGDFAVFVSGSIFTLLLIAVLGFAVVRVILRKAKKKAAKKEAAPEEEKTE